MTAGRARQLPAGLPGTQRPRAARPATARSRRQCRSLLRVGSHDRYRSLAGSAASASSSWRWIVCAATPGRLVCAEDSRRRRQGPPLAIAALDAAAPGAQARAARCHALDLPAGRESARSDVDPPGWGSRVLGATARIRLGIAWLRHVGPLLVRRSLLSGMAGRVTAPHRHSIGVMPGAVSAMSDADEAQLTPEDQSASARSRAEPVTRRTIGFKSRIFRIGAMGLYDAGDPQHRTGGAGWIGQDTAARSTAAAGRGASAPKAACSAAPPSRTSMRRKSACNTRSTLRSAASTRNGTHLNVIDTPGYPDFLGRTLSVLEAVESAAIVVSATAGIDTVTQRLMEFARDRELCRLVVVNKIDSRDAKPEAVLASAARNVRRRMPAAQSALRGGAPPSSIASSSPTARRLISRTCRDGAYPDHRPGGRGR